MLEGDLRKRTKCVKKCKDNTWNRWKGEYLKSLREKHNVRCRKETQPALAIGGVVFIKGKEQNRRMVIVFELFKGKDGTVHTAKIRCGKSELEHLYQMELHCDWKHKDCIETNEVHEDEQGQEPRRSKRTAATVAKIKIRDEIEDEQGVPTVQQNLNICYYS